MANGMHLFKNKTNLNFVNIYEYVSVHLEKYIERRTLDCYDWLFWRGRKNRGGWRKLYMWGNYLWNISLVKKFGKFLKSIKSSYFET